MREGLEKFMKGASYEDLNSSFDVFKKKNEDKLKEALGEAEYKDAEALFNAVKGVFVYFLFLCYIYVK